MQNIVPHEGIEKRILLLRGQKVMLDRDLAELYEVETKALNQAVSRNLDRFPEDFMFRLTKQEFKDLRSQIVTSNNGRGGQRYLPYAFTESGVAMLSSVLHSKKAALVNIQIMRAFIRLREMVASNPDFRRAIENLEKRVDIHDRQIGAALNAIKGLLEPPEKKRPKRKMGFV
ncbi:MAG: DNA-binding protein [Elusimicrobia bacterium RIFOXYB2_FULL_49_7]|nr:MAG: DNA-binding protein [Elusimicrobia bacterium RIFOXYB2_FULL_49_7]